MLEANHWKKLLVSGTETANQQPVVDCPLEDIEITETVLKSWIMWDELIAMKGKTSSAANVASKFQQLLLNSSGSTNCCACGLV